MEVTIVTCRVVILSCHFGNSKQLVCCPWPLTPSGAPRALAPLSLGLASAPEVCNLTQLSVGLYRDNWAVNGHTGENSLPDPVFLVAETDAKGDQETNPWQMLVQQAPHQLNPWIQGPHKYPV